MSLGTADTVSLSNLVSAGCAGFEARVAAMTVLARSGLQRVVGRPLIGMSGRPRTRESHT